MGARTCLTIVLAAGEGTRMRSRLPKVLHQVGGQTLLAHVLAAARAADSERLAVVVGPGREDVAAEVKRLAPDAAIAVQSERRGTAHAVLAARKTIAQGADDILVAFADTPLIRPQTLDRMRAALAEGAAVVVLGFRPRDPSGYGRLVMDGTALSAIREEKDASEAERAITLCNAGLMALAGGSALSLLDKIGCGNAKREFYLTDVVALARADGLRTAVIEAEEDEVRGINTKAQLAEAEAALQQRLRRAALEAGVTMIAPETVYLSADTAFGEDVVVEPYVVFGPGVRVGDRAVIHAFSHLAGAQVGEEASIGPYARLRPGTVVGRGARVGNFVELKAAVMEAGAKANHLSYIGDGRVGEGANIGAGTIFCNYDGARKHHTDVGKGAFIGSNSALVAPVTIGDGAYVGSGSVITDDVPADALALGRVKQVVKEGWAQRLRNLKGAGKNST
ncbi:MAG: bifunctional UDP-N-acetylglucosamine diphosphorylase/glucosamine-1-phosphate N-acetyltransferase GlmU [Pseudorhodoplanes sp.]|nr:bifunctional UDP-N-acetylglucosamine diphosphorylase/glucosamine-1-phosphate N-acetyltransferase GlmU [Pseudorhodoplanes sp.]GIK82367.1 MAG: bifunctional protein GlmU [Alphaproteobacteria bacterium]